MLVIHLNNRRTIKTDRTFADLSKDIEDNNLGYVTVYRYIEPLQDTPISSLYAGRDFVECVIDKNEIAFIDILD